MNNFFSKKTFKNRVGGLSILLRLPMFRDSKTVISMKNVYFFLAFFLSSFSINAQELIFNGSFEEENNCSEFRVHCSPVAWYSTSTGENAYGYRNGLFFPKKGRHCS